MNNDINKYKLSSLSVAIIDDHEVVLEGFKSYMVKNGVAEVEAFGTVRALLNRMDSKHFDVYMVDVELPDMDASELIDEIRARHAEARIVINTMHEEMWVVRKMTKKLVDGVVYKSGQLDQLLEAIITVSEGGQYFCNKFKRSDQRLKLQNDILSKRETEVLEAIAKGMSTKKIAKLLYISENTVETHRQNLFSKLNAHNMAELIIKAVSCGYINPNSPKETL